VGGPAEDGVLRRYVNRKWFAPGVGMIKWNIENGETEYGSLVKTEGL
jgi:hypothetical protein